MQFNRKNIKAVPREDRKIIGITPELHQRMSRLLVLLNKEDESETVSLASLALYLIEAGIKVVDPKGESK